MKKEDMSVEPGSLNADEPVRVLQVIGRMSYGGLETLIMNLYKKVDRSKIQFDFLSYTNEKGLYEDEITAMGGKIYHLSFRDDKNYFKYKKDLEKFFEEHPEYKVVHGHLAAVGSMYLGAAKKSGVPCRISHSHIASYSKTRKGILIHIMNRNFGKHASHRFACSKVAGKYMYGKKDFTVLNNGIDCHRFAFDQNERNRVRSELQLDGKIVFVHVGRFFDQKNHSFLIDIFSQIKKLRENSMLLLIGVGPLQDEIREKCKALGIEDSVKFMGSRTDVPSLLSASDVFLFPSLYEGLPLTVVEAQASGLPILSSDQVTEEVVMTEECQRISLDLGADVWAQKALELLNCKIDRESRYRIVIDNGYDSDDVANSLQNFYLDFYKEK